MEGNLPSGSSILGAPFGALDSDVSIPLHGESNQSHQQFHYPTHKKSVPHHLVHPPMHDMFSLATNSMQDFSGSKEDRGKSSVSDEDDEGQDGQQQDSKGKKASPWHRVKWTDNMVKLLVTAVLYIDEDVDSDFDSGRRRYTMLKKKGKWKVVSNAMSERGFCVSPQQCEDKFNDLNKRYKRLTDILGRGTSCKVVENPALLEGMKLSDKLKDDARKILSSKHLHYEEMCSYYNRNLLCLLDDPVLKRSLHMALRGGDEHDLRKGAVDDIDEDDETVDSDDDDDDDDSGGDRENIAETHHTRHGAADGPVPSKRMKHDTNEHEELHFGAPSVPNYCTGYHPQDGGAIDMNQAFCEGPHGSLADKSSLDSCSLQLEKQRLVIHDQMLKLERQHFKWERFSKKKDRELQRMTLENERMKLENDRLALELKRKELELAFKQKSNQ